MIRRHRPTRNHGWPLTLIILIMCSGCDGLFTAKKSQTSATVSGKVLAGDQPVANAKILFLPLDSSDGRYRYSYAKTNEQGRFTMRFESGVYGAYVGKNLVLISTCEIEEATASDNKANEKLVRAETVSPRFNKASELFIDVDPGGNSDVIFAVDLVGDALQP